MSKEKLYIVVPYFNHTNAAINRTNFELCLRNLRAYTHVRVIVAEGIWNKDANLPNFGDLVYKHLKFELQSPIWVKENLINLGIQSLNTDWEYVCWLDKDINFLNPNWDIDTINKLKEYDIIQPWSRVQFLNKSYEIDMLRSNEKSSVFIESFYQCPDKEKDKGFLSYAKASQLGYGRSGHPGHAWAINRKFYEKIGGLFDRCIVGGADSFMVVAMDETFNVPHLAIKELYEDFFQTYVNKTRGTKVGYIEGTIVHYFHGEIVNRNYYGRFNILNNKIDLKNDLGYSNNGTLMINKPNIEKDILDYFYSRKEHTI
jgi:hypothetical protein